MIRIKRMLACLLTVFLFAAFLGSSSSIASAAEGSDASSSVPIPEDFAGEYTCTTISFGKNIVPLQDGESYALTIDGEEAVFAGFPELGTDPLPLQFEDGELYFMPPEEEERVFTLGLLSNGVVTLTFDRIPDAPVFRFDPTGPASKDFAGEYACTTISFGKNIMPLQDGESYTLTIDGEEAVFTGFPELGTDPLPLQFEDGELYFMPPEEEERVFTLHLLNDGVVTLTFDRIPDAPVFRFDPAEPSS